MKRIKDPVVHELIIDKSRFITRLFRVISVEEVSQHLEDTRKIHADANHNCYAYILGDRQELMKASDDGEPQKTAGFPMLDALKKNDLTDVLAITTRYFGGIKLGAGGLIRAYSKSVSHALEDVVYVLQVTQEVLKLTYDYADVKYVESSIKEKSTIVAMDYDAYVHFTVSLDQLHVLAFIDALKDQNRGKISYVSLGMRVVDKVIETKSKDA